MALQTLAALCICLLLATTMPAQTPADTVRADVQVLKPGTPVKVRLLDKHELRGRLAEVRAEEFTLQVAQGERVETRALAYSEVRWVRQAADRPKRYRAIGWTLAGVMVTAVTLTVVSLH